MSTGPVFGITEICRRIPHRFPMLMIDRIRDLEPGIRGTAVKNVTINEQFFQGHFPMEPIVPGVLIIESIAQTAAVVLAAADDVSAGGGGPLRPHYLVMVEKMKFRKPVVPGDTMIITAEVMKKFGSMIRVKGEVRVDERVVVSGEIVVGTGES